MPKQNQINALVTGKKSVVTKEVGDIYKVVQQKSLFDGRTRVYRPLDEERGETLPPEQQNIQYRVKDLCNLAVSKWTELWDLVYTQDTGNQNAAADVVVEDVGTLLSQVPVTTLLFLEKQVNDLETFISHLPVPDATEKWDYDPSTGVLRTQPTVSVRTKKIPRNHIKYEATDKHPAQVDVYYEDVQVGTWTQTLFTGRITVQEKNDALQRVRKLKDALKLAREQANLVDVKSMKLGKTVFDFVFGGMNLPK